MTEARALYVPFAYISLMIRFACPIMIFPLQWAYLLKRADLDTPTPIDHPKPGGNRR